MNIFPVFVGDPADPYRPPDQPPVSKGEIQLWSHERSADASIAGMPVVQPLPSVGDLVAFRRNPWGLTVPARVLGVQPVDVLQHPDWSGGQPNPNVFQEDEFGQWSPKWDPWPEVDIETLSAPGRPFELRGGQRLRCSEARVRGSCGWLWPGHRWDTPWERGPGG